MDLKQNFADVQPGLYHCYIGSKTLLLTPHTDTKR